MRFVTAMVWVGLWIQAGLSPLLAQPINSEREIGLENTAQRTYTTSRLSGESPLIDGNLRDSCWAQVSWSGDFTQRSPEDGGHPLQPTAFKILYDDRNLYIAWRCYDSAPDSLVRRMSRRDGFEGDWVEINLDSYFDKRTAFSFTASVSGVRNDEMVSNDGRSWDPTWNPVWYLKTSIDSLGWVAEARIPLNQLRFADLPKQVWGIQVTRRNFRHESRSVWQYIPQNSGYWVSGFGELHGIKGVKPPRRIELQPFMLASYQRFPALDGDPLEDGSRYVLNTGLDGKFGVTSDLTVDFTVNSDFGQVEADPSAININGFQIFFQERRPFFVESQNIFEYPVNGGGGGDLLFYSRRIGAAPVKQLSADPEVERYVSQPEQTTLLGAAKLSGKTRKGLSVGLLESLTAREYATISSKGEESRLAVQPLANYVVARVMQDFREGNTVIGGILTATSRSWDGQEFSPYLHNRAFSGGIDGIHRWSDQTWKVEGSLYGSRVEGSPERILKTQTAFEHLFQRPDARHLSIDSSATSLSGYGGHLDFGKIRGNLTFNTGVSWRSPGLELNDVGFLSQTDLIRMQSGVRYQINRPNGLFRTYSGSLNHRLNWNFAGQHLHQSLQTNLRGEFRNFWVASLGFGKELKDISQTALFGGPSLRRPNGSSVSLNVSTDRRSRIIYSIGTSQVWGTDNGIRIWSVEGGVDWRPIDALRVSTLASFRVFQRPVQYVGRAVFDELTRYIAGSVDQRTLSITLRINYNITPDFTIQFYGQPFISRGRYSDYKYIANPQSKVLAERFTPYTSSEISGVDGVFNIRESDSLLPEYSFRDPDFSFVQFRSNLVARWEYIPGSELFLVWSQSTTPPGNPADELWRSFTQGFGGQLGSHNLVVKLTYRFYR
ncbi:MAG: DUF5916 domain-containing protein [Saprospiraceae bacterium]